MDKIDTIQDTELQHKKNYRYDYMQHIIYMYHTHAPITSFAVCMYIVNHTPGGARPGLEQMFFPAYWHVINTWLGAKQTSRTRAEC